MIKILSVVLISLFFIGCGGFSKNDILNNKQVSTSSYLTKNNYQKEYLNLYNRLEECYAWESAGVGQKVSGQIYTELNMAEISLKFDNYYRVLIQIKKGNMTEVKIYNAFSNVENMKDILIGKKACK